MPKFILVLLFLSCYSPSLAFAKGKPGIPNTVQEFKIIYFDYTPDKEFNFSKLSKPEFEEVQSYINSEIEEINGALNMPDSKLRDSMVAQKVDTFLIQIYKEEEKDYMAYPCAPYFDDRELDYCAVETIIHVYGRWVCISERDEYATLGAEEFSKPTCPPGSERSNKSRHKSLLSFSGYLKLKSP